MYLEIPDHIVEVCVGICDDNEIPYANEAEAIELVISLINIPPPPPPQIEVAPSPPNGPSIEELLEEEMQKQKAIQSAELLKGVTR